MGACQRWNVLRPLGDQKVTLVLQNGPRTAAKLGEAAPGRAELARLLGDR